MSRKQIVTLIIISLLVVMVLDFQVNGVGVFASYFTQLQTDSIRNINIENNPKASKKAHLNIKADGIKSFKLENKMGSIKIQGEDRDDVDINYKITVYADQEEEAKNYLNSISTESIRTEEQLELILKTGEIPENIRGIKVNYDIKVPADLLLDLKNNYGNLTILDIENNVSALSRYSQTEVKNIGKDLKLNTEYSSVDLENISGDLFLNSRYGAVEIDKLKGQGQLKSGYTAVNISGIQGDLTGEMKYGELTLKNPEQSVQLEGTYTDLNLIFDDILINHEFNCITRYGDIKSELGIPIISSGNEKKMEGKIGRGKNNISLETKYGDINITKSYSVK